jgi:hypothetical protein
MHLILILVGTLFYSLSGNVSYADEMISWNEFTNDDLNMTSMDKCKDGICPFPTKQVCFDMVCNYKSKSRDSYDPRDSQYKTCRAAVRFQKWVGVDGREVWDTSTTPFNPEFEVECDHQLIYHSAGTRFTDELGTRIQAETSPYPAILLPKGALREGHRYALSSLELDGQALRGHCYLYTTNP